MKQGGRFRDRPDSAAGARPARPARLLSATLLVMLAVAALVPALGTVSGPNAADAAPAKPNIILIVTDDQRADTLKYMPLVRQRLASRGTTFTNATVVTPTCCPGRVGILTGQYTHDHEIWHNVLPQGGAQKFRTTGGDQTTIATRLDAAGYETFMVGKYLNEYKKTPEYIPPGWDDWHGQTKGHLYYDYDLNENGTQTHFGGAEGDYSTDVFKTRAVNFIRRTQEPFFMYVTPDAPHDDYGGPPLVAPRHAGSCETLNLPNPPSFNEEDMADKPAWIRRYRPLDGPAIAAIARERRDQICSLKAVDEMVGAIVRALQDTGKFDNTMIIFTSDNGYTWGEHRFNTKNCAYEECIRVPLVIYAPMYSTTARTDTHLAQNIDLWPTIAQAAGIPLPPAQGVDGQSLVPLLRGGTGPFRSAVLIEYYNNHAVTDIEAQRYDAAVRTDRYKYVMLGTGEEEFYDLAPDKDPYELTNTIADSVYAEEIARLRPKLAALRASS